MARPILETSTARSRDPARLRLWLVGLVGVAMLDALGRLTYWGRHHGGDAWLRWLGAEARWSVPSLLAALLLLACGVACLRQREEPLRWWRAAGALFLLFGANDLLGLHRPLLRLAQFHPVLHASLLSLAPLVMAAALAAAMHILLVLPPIRRGRWASGLAALVLAAGAFVAMGLTTTGQLWRGLPLWSYLQWVQQTASLLGPFLLLTAVQVPPTSPDDAPFVRFVGAGR
jgi:hypothetical protein